MVAAQSKAWVYGISLARIAGLNPTRGMDICLLCVIFFSGIGLCNNPITRSEESYRVWCG